MTTCEREKDTREMGARVTSMHREKSRDDEEGTEETICNECTRNSMIDLS
jgi:hypothetical protein